MKHKTNQKKVNGSIKWMGVLILLLLLLSLLSFYCTVHLVLHATPGTPIIKKKNFKVDYNWTVGQIIALIRKFINLDQSESLVWKFILSLLR